MRPFIYIQSIAVTFCFPGRLSFSGVALRKGRVRRRRAARGDVRDVTRCIGHVAPPTTQTTALRRFRNRGEEDSPRRALGASPKKRARRAESVIFGKMGDIFIVHFCRRCSSPPSAFCRLRGDRGVAILNSPASGHVFHLLLRTSRDRSPASSSTSLVPSPHLLAVTSLQQERFLKKTKPAKKMER